MIGNAEFAGDEDASKSEWSRWWSRINLSEQLSLKRLSLSSTEDLCWTVERVMSLDLFEIPSKPKHYQLKTPSSALYFKGWICCHSPVNNPAKLPAPHIALAVALPHHFSADCSSCLTKKYPESWQSCAEVMLLPHLMSGYIEPSVKWRP